MYYLYILNREKQRNLLLTVTLIQCSLYSLIERGKAGPCAWKGWKHSRHGAEVLIGLAAACSHAGGRRAWCGRLLYRLCMGWKLCILEGETWQQPSSWGERAWCPSVSSSWSLSSFSHRVNPMIYVPCYIVIQSSIISGLSSDGNMQNRVVTLERRLGCSKLLCCIERAEHICIAAFL